MSLPITLSYLIHRFVLVRKPSENSQKYCFKYLTITWLLAKEKNRGPKSTIVARFASDWPPLLDRLSFTERKLDCPMVIMNS